MKRYLLLLSMLLLFSLLSGCNECKSLCNKAFDCLSEKGKQTLENKAQHLSKCTQKCEAEKKSGGRYLLVKDAINSACR